MLSMFDNSKEGVRCGLSLRAIAVETVVVSDSSLLYTVHGRACWFRLGWVWKVALGGGLLYVISLECACWATQK